MRQISQKVIGYTAFAIGQVVFMVCGGLLFIEAVRGDGGSGRTVVGISIMVASLVAMIVGWKYIKARPRAGG